MMVIVINILSKNLIFAALYKIIYREVCSYDYTCSFCCTLLNYVLVHNIVICTSNSEKQDYYFKEDMIALRRGRVILLQCDSYRRLSCVLFSEVLSRIVR